ncbi:MAG: hypothetical protein M5R40_27800 [Anaerolineae bacterium]|nr:hypothetical protein [Anaerolineae bacterium]
MTETKPPRRPLGLSLMLVMCFALYVVLPLLSVLYPWVLALVYRPAGGDSGADIGGWGLLQVVYSLVFGVVLVLAWLGRPARIRWAVAGLALIQAALVLGRGFWLQSQPPPLDSMAELERATQPLLMVSAAALGLFVSWYVNRAPAVAFFTGAPIDYVEDAT